MSGPTFAEQEAALLPSAIKPARKQVKPGDVVKGRPKQTGNEYNIWYNKWAGGDREDPYSSKEKAQTRCNVKRDSGLTRANKTGMKYICLFFARGCCPYGWECEYLHTLPVGGVVLPDTSKDCFARDKFADYRDDMGGVGTFTRINRTLYVGRVKETGDGEHTEEVVRRHFGMFGVIEKVRILQFRSVAFVTFVSELSAQFAKEAMACQSLDNDEILNVRWATEDPNPGQKEAERQRLEVLGKDAVQGNINPRIVDAVRHLRALEEGVMLEDDVDSREPSPVSTDEEEPARKKLKASSEVQKNASMLQPTVLEDLKRIASSQRQRHGHTVRLVPGAPAQTDSLGLAGYGSDED